jgi:chaperonin GroES
MEKNKLKPLGNRILVKRNEATTTRGGILLPDTAKEKPRQGIVVAVGPGSTDDKGRCHPLDVKVGDHVLFSSYSGTEYQDECLILSEDDLLAVLS